MTYEGGEKVEKQRQVEKDMVAMNIRVFVGIKMLSVVLASAISMAIRCTKKILTIDPQSIANTMDRRAGYFASAKGYFPVFPRPIL